MRFGLIFVLFLLAACSSRPGPELLSDVPAYPGAKLVKVYVATTRARQNPGGNVFTSDLAGGLNFAEFTISIPPGHVPGTVQWPEDNNIDPSRSFATVSQRVLTRKEFEARVAPGRGTKKAGLFIHGFNVNFQEALFQLAQMKFDSDLTGEAVLFAWPSEASVSAYVADKDAVTASRDGLAEVIRILDHGRGAGDTLVLAHSMGTWLTMETLRQLKLTGYGAVVDRLDVILAAPDIDTQVFLSQMEVIGRMKRTMRILVATDDLALSVSARIAGGRKRVGSIDVHNPRVQMAAQRLNIQTIDISSIESTDSFNHSRFVQAVALRSKLDAMGKQGGVRQAGAFVLNAVGATLASPFAIVGQVIGGE